jgi:heme/copper-type cytochrome/quinol oxidase subunit 2
MIVAMNPLLLKFGRPLQRMLIAICLAVVVVATPMTARASEDEPTSYDARIEGYPQKVQLDAGSTALTWLLLIVLGVLSVAVLFKDAKRSHLD